MSDKLRISLGAISEPLSQQLKGCGVPRAKLSKFQRIANAISLLAVQGLINERAASSARSKLIDRVAQQCKRGNVKEEPTK